MAPQAIKSKSLLLSQGNEYQKGKALPSHVEVGILQQVQFESIFLHTSLCQDLCCSSPRGCEFHCDVRQRELLDTSWFLSQASLLWCGPTGLGELMTASLPGT